MNPSLAYRFCERPVALAPEFLRPLMMALTPGASIAQQETTPVDDDMRAYRMHAGGIAEISVSGVLVYSDAGFEGETTYSDIVGSVLMAVADPSVKAIVLAIESPGGEVDGCFEAAEAIYSLRGMKPIVAILDPYAYSAAYALASAANMICVPETGGSGSVGVVSMHVEMSKMLDQAGIGVTAIQFGDQKTERGPFTPLSAAAKGRIQADVDVLGEMFVELVARNRGMTTAEVRATQAGVFMGADGVKVGFADAVFDPPTALGQLQLTLMRQNLLQET
jgi:signal peptide peptidase SppA